MSDIRERFSQEQGPGGLEARGYQTETRAEDDEFPAISGIGSPYGQMTRIAGWVEEWDEVVADGAWRNAITKEDVDIVSTFNHDLNQLLARTTSDTLFLSDPAEGLVYEAKINPDDPQAMSVHARVVRRDVTGASVWFRVLKDQWEEPSDDNDLEVPLRTILSADLFEVGPVVFPAFPQTTAEAASFDRLGFKREAMSALDESLRSAGITRHVSRAAYAFRFSADPETEIRELFRQLPDLQARVCGPSAADDQPRTLIQPNEELYSKFTRRQDNGQA